MVDLPDLESLSAWMGARDGKAAPCAGARRLQAGTQNLMVMFERAGSRHVFRQPPAKALYAPAKTVEREARILSALNDSHVPHPALFGYNLDDAVLGGPFCIMDAVDGFNAVEGLPGEIRSDDLSQRRMALAVVDAAVALSVFDVEAAGLSGLGNAAGFLERQVVRWRKQLDSYAMFDGWVAQGTFQDVDIVGDWLAVHRPDRDHIGLIHGDFHLGNMLFRPDGSAVAAIIDWELATIGDPLIDLGWLIATWPSSDGADTGSGIAVPGATALPSPQSLADHYKAVSRDDLRDIDWFVVLACYKLGIIQEGSWARALAGQADRDVGMQQHHRAMAMIAKAQALIQNTAFDKRRRTRSDESDTQSPEHDRKDRSGGGWDQRHRQRNRTGDASAGRDSACVGPAGERQ